MTADHDWLAELDAAGPLLWLVNIRATWHEVPDCTVDTCPETATHWTRLACGCNHTMCGPHHGLLNLAREMDRQRRRPFRCDTCGFAGRPSHAKGGLL